MASTTAMFTGLSGLNANARNLDVIGNNIANINTTAYKSNRMVFASQFSRSLSFGSQPGTETGGTNPTQIGLGVSIAGTQRNFNPGSLQSTGDQRDLAIDGDGFFVVQRGSQQYYTRAGSFRQNPLNDLITVGGERVMGYGVDADFNIVAGTVQPLNLPVGQLRVAQATKSVFLSGSLNTSGAVATKGSTNTSVALRTVAGNPATVPVSGATLLTDVDDPNASGFQALFANGQTIKLAGATKGGKAVPAATFTVTGATTLANLATFIQDSLAINTTAGNNPDGSTPGVTVTGGGALQIIGNSGTVNDLTIPDGALSIVGVTPNPLTGLINGSSGPAKVAATGESARAATYVYDSLGNQIQVDVSFVQVAQTGGAGTTWKYFVELASAPPTGTNRVLASGNVAFDVNGGGATPSSLSINIPRNGSGAADPLTVTISLTAPSSTVKALGTGVNTPSTLGQTSQDGSSAGTLTSYSFGADGTINGTFSNGITRTLGQIAVAKFTNTEGLVDIGGGLYNVGANSGDAIITNPGAFGTGRVVGGSLELANVDLAQEFINLISASTGYSASSRVITTADQLLQQLLVIGR